MISEKIRTSLSSFVQNSIEISRRRANIKVAIKNRKSWRVIIGGPGIIMVTLVPILSRFSILMTIQLLIFSWAEQILLLEIDNSAQCSMSAPRFWVLTRPARQTFISTSYCCKQINGFIPTFDEESGYYFNWVREIECLFISSSTSIKPRAQHKLALKVKVASTDTIMELKTSYPDPL